MDYQFEKERKHANENGGGWNVNWWATNKILERDKITASRKISVVITLRVCCDHSDDLFPPIRIVNAKIFKGEVTENCADRSVYKRRKAFQRWIYFKSFNYKFNEKRLYACYKDWTIDVAVSIIHLGALETRTRYKIKQLSTQRQRVKTEPNELYHQTFDCVLAPPILMQ